jgi:uncharacterized membrane protein YcjF (UPF0283 family)
MDFDNDYDLTAELVTSKFFMHYYAQRHHRRLQEVSMGKYNVDLKSDEYNGLSLLNWIFVAVAILIILVCVLCACSCFVRCTIRKRQQDHRKQEKNAHKKAAAAERKSFFTRSLFGMQGDNNVDKDAEKLHTPKSSAKVEMTEHYEEDLQDVELNDSKETYNTKKPWWFFSENPFNNGKRMSLDS